MQVGGQNYFLKFFEIFKFIKVFTLVEMSSVYINFIEIFKKFYLQNTVFYMEQMLDF